MADLQSSESKQPVQQPQGSVLEVLLAFSRLGLTCFGGPIAHIGYFRAEFIVRRAWLDEVAYADLVALCQIIPGPASSQVAFAMGFNRAGWLGGVAAWVGFTLPSAVALILFATEVTQRSALEQGVIHGLKLVAVAVVAQAVFGMARAFCRDRILVSIATGCAVAVLLIATAFVQIAAIFLGGLVGALLCQSDHRQGVGRSMISVPRRTGVIALVVFLLLLIAPPCVQAVTGSHTLRIFDAFYRTGALVWGGGHVVLPLLHDAIVTPGWVSETQFLAGYGASQAVPGPLFSFAAFLGASSRLSPSGPIGAALATAAIFLPGFLILIGVLPFWQQIANDSKLQAGLSGINAAVVGILAAALFNPIWISSIGDSKDFAFAFFAFSLLIAWKAPPLLIVVLGIAFGSLRVL
jgi:chromate transporter